MLLNTQFHRFVAQHELFDSEDRMLVAVSGGIDSTALLDMLASEGYPIAIAHCNFSLRGSESDGDEQLVRELQQKYGIEGFYIRFNTEEEAQKAGESIQMTARRLRYAWFNELCNLEDYRYIAIAHNADDVAETFFLNLTRGTGIKGLTGIKPKTGRVVRPLLFATRRQIEEYSAQRGLKFREDSSNLKDKYARNRIRLNVMPELKQINPAFNQTMLDNIARLQLVESLVNQEVNSFKRDCISICGDEQRISIRQLAFNPNAQLLLYEVLNDYGFSSSQVESILKSLHSGESGKVFEANRYSLLRDREQLILYPNQAATCDTVEVGAEAESIAEPLNLTLRRLVKDDAYRIVRDSAIAHIDADKLSFPLTLRKWKHGDEFYPLGMKGKKKLSDFFIDQKLSILDKQHQWLLCSGTEVVWVVGRRLDNRFRITDDTQHILEVRLNG